MLVRTQGCGYRIVKRTEIAVVIAVIVAPDCALVRDKGLQQSARLASH